MTKRMEYTPDVALEQIIGLERHREQCNASEVCVICGKPANSKHYPAPFHDDSYHTVHSKHPRVWYRACGIDHADRFYRDYVDLHNDVLRPWRELRFALERREGWAVAFWKQQGWAADFGKQQER